MSATNTLCCLFHLHSIIYFDADCLDLSHALRSAGREVEVEIIAGVGHAFDERVHEEGSGPQVYDSAATQRAIGHLRDFLTALAGQASL